jgi:ORF6N domain
MLSSDLAPLYGVQVKVLVQAVKRNRSRFPADFMFQLTRNEMKLLKSQNVTSSWGGARRARPYAFTEHGVAMLSGVLRSDRAVRVNIEIMRAFVQLRHASVAYEDLRRKIAQMERKYDSRFQAVFATFREMLEIPERSKRRIGFHN